MTGLCRMLLVLSAALVADTALAASSTLRDFAEAMRATPDLAHGADLFTKCAACHGASGGGSDDGKVPRIAGQHFNVLVRQLVDYRHNQRWDIRMEHFAGRQLLADSQSIADVAAYASSLQRYQPRQVGDGQFVKQGAAIYAQKCAKCHRPQGEGDDAEVIPRVSGQHYDYILRQMHDAVDGRRPNFSPAHIKLLSDLQYEDLLGLADFLSRAEWKGPAQPLVMLR